MRLRCGEGVANGRRVLQVGRDMKFSAILAAVFHRSLIRSVLPRLHATVDSIDSNRVVHAYSVGARTTFAFPSA